MKGFLLTLFLVISLSPRAQNKKRHIFFEAGVNASYSIYPLWGAGAHGKIIVPYKWNKAFVLTVQADKLLGHDDYIHPTDYDFSLWTIAIGHRRVYKDFMLESHFGLGKFYSFKPEEYRKTGFSLGIEPGYLFKRVTISIPIRIMGDPDPLELGYFLGFGIRAGVRF